MDFIRTNIMQRGEPAQTAVIPDLEQQAQTETRAHLATYQRTLPFAFTGWPGRNTTRAQETRAEGSNDAEGPKSPRPGSALGLPSFSAARIRMPSLTRARNNESPRRRSSSSSSSSAAASRTHEATESASRPSVARTRAARFSMVAWPEPLHVHGQTEEGRNNSHGGDPAQLHLVDLAEEGRRRRDRHRHRHRQDRNRNRNRHRHGHGHGGFDDPQERERMTARHGEGDHPKRFLFCFPWVKSRRVRTQVLRCFVSGIFLILMLSIYLSLSITKNINTSEFTILLIVIVIFTTIFFAHSLVRLCMLLIKPREQLEAEDAEAEAIRRGRPHRLPEMYGPGGGYVVPRRPIRVLLARDEEAAGIESETVKLEPPAYGRWRESVRVDPDRIYWQRNETQPGTTGEADEEVEYRSEAGTNGQPRTVAPRPPSYASEDGVDYVVEARPRSIAPPPSGAASVDVSRLQTHYQTNHNLSAEPIVEEALWPDVGRRVL